MIPGYRILRTIGKGGAAVVYLAEKAAAPGLVVLKILHQHASGGAGSPDVTLATSATGLPARLKREAALIGALDHPNIVHVLDAGEVDGVGFIAMEYLEGGDLEARIAAGLDVVTALDVACSVSLALAFAHAEGVVHRDVKPQNILFRTDGTPVLSDFGVAKRLDDDLGLTLEGISIGSPFYMSPEQAKGEAVDGRADIYSLGVILFEMLTGRPPFEAESALGVILKHIHQDIPRLPPEYAGFQPLVDRMLVKDPAARVGSAERLARLLGEVRERVARAEAPGVAAGPIDPGAQQATPTLLGHLRAGIQEDLEYDRLMLPSLPEVAIKIREALAGGNASVTEVATLMAADPAISAQVMKVANSAFFPGSVPVKDLKTAVVRLGGNAVRHLVMVIVAAQLFQAKHGGLPSRRLKAVWKHSVLVGALSRVIGESRGRLDPEVALLAGLIHRIGVLPVLEWASRIPHLAEHPARLDRFVERVHADIGVMILARWNYPEDLIRVVREHEQASGEAVRDVDYVDVVALAYRLAADHPQENAVTPARPGGYFLAGTPLPDDEVLALLARGRRDAAALFSVFEP